MVLDQETLDTLDYGTSFSLRPQDWEPGTQVSNDIHQIDSNGYTLTAPQKTEEWREWFGELIDEWEDETLPNETEFGYAMLARRIHWQWIMDLTTSNAFLQAYFMLIEKSGITKYE